MINQILFKRIDKKFGSALQSVWDESHHQNLGPELRGRNIGVKSHLDTFNYLYGVTILELVPRHTNNLPRTIKKTLTPACKRKEDANLTFVTLNSLR